VVASLSSCWFGKSLPAVWAKIARKKRQTWCKFRGLGSVLDGGKVASVMVTMGARTYEYPLTELQVATPDDTTEMISRCSSLGIAYVNTSEEATCIINSNGEGYNYGNVADTSACPYPAGATPWMTNAECLSNYTKWIDKGVTEVTLADGTTAMTGIGHGVLEGVRGLCAIIYYEATGKTVVIFQVDIRSWSLEMTQATWEYLTEMTDVGSIPEPVVPNELQDFNKHSTYWKSGLRLAPADFSFLFLVGEGFEVNTLYSVSVETNEPGGVGHVIISSAGAFQEEPSRPSAACTMYSEKHSRRSWQWMSPTAANSSSFFAICVTGYGGRAYVADALTVFSDGQPQEMCNPSNSTAVIADCHCLAVDGDPGNSICAAGECCWEDLRCRHCSGGSRPATPMLESWALLHCFLACFGVALQLIVHVTEATYQRQHLMLASCIFQCVGAGFSFGPLVNSSAHAGSLGEWHVILGSVAVGCSIYLIIWSWVRDDAQSVFALLQSCAVLILGWLTAGLGCVAKAERQWRALNNVLVLVIFLLSCVYAVTLWNRKRRRFGQLGAERGQIEIPHSHSDTSCRAAVEQMSVADASTMSLRPRGA
ncbi:unnamed protein product, partial [Symbiodinium sp. CCMP2456]